MESSILDHLLRASPSPGEIPSLNAWRARLLECPSMAAAAQIDRALWAGFEADRLGYAFVGGYRAALSSLFDPVLIKAGRMPLGAMVSLAATEKGGGHPKAIETTLTESGGGSSFVLNGEKTFATMASVCDDMLVVAKRGVGDDGKNQLAVVCIRRDAPGVTIASRDPTPFAPEIPHARVTFANVKVADVLPGDGYSEYLKPFRTAEDTHVLGAALGHVIRMTRLFNLDKTITESALGFVVGVRAVATTMSPNDPKAHLILAGIFNGTRKLIADHEAAWASIAEKEGGKPVAERFHRDLGLLMIAEMVRTKRTEAAWKSLST